MESLRLAIDMLDRVDAVEGNEQSVDAKKEARRLLRRRPDADVNKEEVADILRQELGHPSSHMWIEGSADTPSAIEPGEHRST